MKWFDIEKGNLKLSFCVTAYDWMDGYVTFNSIEVRNGDSIVFSLYNKPILENDHVVYLIRTLDVLLKKIPGKDTFLDWDIFDLRFFYEPINDSYMEMRVYPGKVINNSILDYMDHHSYLWYTNSKEDAMKAQIFLQELIRKKDE